jgi:hypothetical protein
MRYIINLVLMAAAATALPQPAPQLPPGVVTPEQAAEQARAAFMPHDAAIRGT